MPFRSITFLISCLVLSIPLGASVEIDPGNRWQVRQFFNAVYPADPEVAPDWTGDHATGQPGTVSGEWQAATRQRVDFFRTLAGIPGKVTFDPDRSRMAQQAALMMSAAGRLSHDPGPDWPWYTEEGALAAARSNLALGTSGPNGPDAVDGYMVDPGSSNTGVGHRRWLLYPHPVPMGNGDVPADGSGTYQAANAIWVIPEESSPRLSTRDPYVAWPPRGFVPAQLVYSRWSFSHPGADFSTASVSMESAGVEIPLSLEPLDERRIGDPTLVWVPDGMPTDTRAHWPLPPEDEPVTVTVANVLIDGSPESFTYTVTIFDPAAEGPGEFASRPVLDGVLSPGQAASFTVEAPPWSEAIQARIIGTAPGVPAFGGEPGEPDLIGDTHASYSPVQESRVASGSSAYKLAHPAARSESLTLPGEYLVGSNTAVLTFDSSLAWATGNQAARVEINTSSGESWIPLWSQSGPVETNSGFTPVSIDLGPWSGQTVRFRFLYYFDGGQYYPQADPGIGWAFDSIRLEGVETVESIEELPVQEGSTRFSLTHATDDPLHLQTRSYAFGGFPLPWGAVTRFDPDPSGSGLLTRTDEWIFDPVIGWNYADSEVSTRSANMGWIDHSAFPWIWTGAGWIYYQRGTLAEGLWIYHAEWGQAFTHESYGPWFTHQPWDPSSWKSFIP